MDLAVKALLKDVSSFLSSAVLVVAFSARKFSPNLAVKLGSPFTIRLLSSLGGERKGSRRSLPKVDRGEDQSARSLLSRLST